MAHTPDSNETFSHLLAEHRDKLKRMVACRMDGRIRGRVDPSDVIQEAFVEATRRYGEYQRQGKMPFYLWLRFITLQQLLIHHRQHLRTRMRTVEREFSLDQGVGPVPDMVSLADVLSGSVTSPSSAAARKERQARLVAALNAMEAKDREVLTLRHFEQLNTAESAQVLGISEALVCTRYSRAIRKLVAVFKELFGAESENPL
jgi:RNA polymerase sigma-70 factor, ECF subfamily